jgi:hypothetical protein
VGDPRIYRFAFVGAAELMHEIHHAARQQRADNAFGGRAAGG